MNYLCLQSTETVGVISHCILCVLPVGTGFRWPKTDRWCSGDVGNTVLVHLPVWGFGSIFDPRHYCPLSMRVAIALKRFPVCSASSCASIGGLLAANGAVMPREYFFTVQKARKQGRIPPFRAILPQPSRPPRASLASARPNHATLSGKPFARGRE